MPLSDTAIRKLSSRSRAYQKADGGGLFVEVMPGGKKAWRLRYWLRGKQEKVTLGSYPAMALTEARELRERYKGMVERGDSPMRRKAAERRSRDLPDTVEEFAAIWMKEVVEPATKDTRSIRQVLRKDILPSFGARRLDEVTPADVLSMTDRIKARGSDQMALLARNVLKRLFAFAIARQKASFNPAAAVQAAYIAKARSRDVALTPDEVGRLLRTVYASNMRRANKLAIHLLILTMVRKGELIEAQWIEFDLKAKVWTIPAERMKKDRPHVVYLPSQAVAMLEELKVIGCGAQHVFPSRHDLRKPISDSTLNTAIRATNPEVQDFVLHDFRRTASTLAHEANWNSDVIEKALGHEQKGVRGVYNKAQYAEQRRELLQWWANFVDAQIEEGRKVVIGRFGN